LHHNCIPPKDWKYTAITDTATRAYIQENFPDLLELVDQGNLVVLQPAAMLADLLQQQRKHAPQQATAAFLAANDAAQAAEAPSFTEEDIAELLSSPQLQHCMAERVPELLVFVGTVHVVKQSANDVTQVIKVCACSQSYSKGPYLSPARLQLAGLQLLGLLQAYCLQP
jgi:hypothetical protein